MGMPAKHKQTTGEHRQGTSRVSTAMFAGKYAKC